MKPAPPRFLVIWIGVGLAVATLITYEPLRHNGFVGYDDDVYVTENVVVRSGLNTRTVAWAFTSMYAANWHPLTWLSHMLDVELFGPNPLGHHGTNLMLHLGSTLLLFGVLKSLTRSLWPSAFVAAAFALHPVHVESVAWVAERKNVLSGFFWILSLATYVRYTHRPGIGRYLLVLICFCLGLMSKPMLVTLPFVLLLLDYWPLGRLGCEGTQVTPMHESSGRSAYTLPCHHALRLIAEKIPLFLLAAVSSWLTYYAQHEAGALNPWQDAPLMMKLWNALVSYLGYIQNLLLPFNLAVLYPYEAKLPIWRILLAIFFLAFVSEKAYTSRLKRPYIAVGWLWYLGTLVPMIGIVQVGAQAMADRYLYIPAIGIFLIIGWMAVELVRKYRRAKLALAITACSVLVLWMGTTRAQIKHWQDSTSLFEHAIEVTQRNWLMHTNLGNTYAAGGEPDRAINQYKSAVDIQPTYYRAHFGLADTLRHQKRFDEALVHLKETARLKPDLNWLNLLMGMTLLGLDRPAEALPYLEQEAEIHPNHGDTRYSLGVALAAVGRYSEGLKHLLEVSHKMPHEANPKKEAAWILATCPDPDLRKPQEALRLAEQASDLAKHQDATTLDVLATAHASVGNFEYARKISRKAIKLATKNQDDDLINQIHHRMNLYEQERPFVQQVKADRDPE